MWIKFHFFFFKLGSNSNLASPTAVNTIKNQSSVSHTSDFVPGSCCCSHYIRVVKNFQVLYTHRLTDDEADTVGNGRSPCGRAVRKVSEMVVEDTGHVCTHMHPSQL